MRIAVGLSGGVDSSVALALLQREGHEVFGLTMRLWKEGRYQGGARDACFGPCEAEGIERAERLCKRLNIPYHVLDCSEDYERLVIENFRSEYLSGRTPNPCVRCNAMMKFGVLPRLAKASGLQFDRFATGHYARIHTDAEGNAHLLMATDRSKDQSYFLARLSQEQLREALFPVGDRTKAEVRALAASLELETKTTPDSQDFYGGDVAELIGEPERPGPIEDITGKRLGTHRGHWLYTVGQRKGLGVAAGAPLYVLRIDACRNAVIVGPAEGTHVHTLTLGEVQWVLKPIEGDCEVRVRSTATPVAAHLSGDTLEIPEGVFAPAPGQTAVLSRGDEILGAALIRSTSTQGGDA